MKMPPDAVAAATLLLLYMCVTIVVSQQPFLTVVGPKTLRPNNAYHVAVSMQPSEQNGGVTPPVTLLVSIDREQLSIGQSVTVEPYATRVVKLEVGDVGPGDYNLTVVSATPSVIQFRHSQQLEYVHKSYSVFIQTDKAIYKPGDMLRFRAVVLDKRLRPGVTGAIDVHITDGAGNRVKQWLRALTSKGVFSGELALSESPVLGDWNVTVRLLNQTFSKRVQVAEYVLPKFEVHVVAPSHTTFAQRRLTVSVQARYIYERRVKGELTVSAHPLIYSGVLQPLFQSVVPTRHVVPIDGDATIDIDLAAELRLGDEYERAVVIEAVVEEALTGRRQNASTRVTLHKHEHRLQLFKTSEYFKPGLNYTAQLYVSKHDGSPGKGVVTVRHGFSYDSDRYVSEEYALNAAGMVDLSFRTPLTNATVLGIEAQFMDVKEWFSAVSASSSLHGAFLQSVLLTSEPTVGSDVEIQVQCTQPFTHLSYEVLGRGDILAAATVRTSTVSSSGTTTTTVLRFSVTPAMTPTAHLIVHVVTSSGELIADALDFDVGGVTQNFVELNLVKEASPGQDVEVTVRTRPNSYVGLLAIDQRVLALRSGNDLTMTDVEQELRSYDSGHPSPYRNHGGEALIEEQPVPSVWHPGTETAYNAFHDSGAIVMTNSEMAEMHPTPETEDARSESPVTAKADLGPGVGLAGVTRPPLAGPYAFSRIPRPRLLWSGPRRFLNDLVPPADTWLFVDTATGIDGKTSIRRTVPDSITSWVISAFSVDPVWGLGLLKQPSRKLRVFQPFFVSLDMPYSVRRGEIVAIAVVVHNYMNQDVRAEVTLDNTDGEFEFAEVSNEVDAEDRPPTEMRKKKTLYVPKDGAAGVSFMVTPKRLGYIQMKVSAKSPLAGDTIHKPLLVVAEGEIQYKNDAIFIDLRGSTSGHFATNITLDIPKNIIPGSEYIEISATGDLLGPTITNLEHLIELPHGCGEQNMLQLVPNILVLEYLKSTEQLTPAVQSRAVKYMEIGYQQELTYRRSDGSFSAFGAADPSGSVWLTAFVARSLRKAAKYIVVEEAVIDDALTWLAENQAANGSFPEVGKVSHQEMQGGGGRGLALTAYVLVAFLEAAPTTTKHRNVIDKAVDYVVRNLASLEADEGVYSLAVAAYALELVQHPSRLGAMNLLEAAANTSTDGMKWWEAHVSEFERKNPWRHSSPNSINIEITSYAMLALLQKGLLEDCLPILKWLVAQRNQNGGFTSTQDTVVGLQALAELGARMAQRNRAPRIALRYQHDHDTTSEFTINQQNSMILQKHQLPRKTRMLNITAEGIGFVVVQVSYRYNVNVTGAWPMFRLDPQVDRNSDRNHLQLSICSGYVGSPNASDAQSNMAVMEVQLPSGYTVDSDALPSLRASPHVRRVETRAADTQLVLYFDHMHRAQEYCPTVSAYRTHKVARQAPAAVQLYDYYDTSRRARVFYAPPPTNLCDICQNEDCNRDCSNSPDTQLADDDSAAVKDKDTGAAARVTTTHLLTVLLLLHYFLITKV